MKEERGVITWFGMDCNIFTNPKVLRFAESVKLDVDAAVGKLGRLYGWAAQCGNETGDISHLPTGELAAIMRWRKKPSVLLDALLESGLLDRAADGRISIHHWDELNGNYMRKKRLDRERKR